MNDFQYYFHQLPCFNCKKTKVSTDLGWLTATMKEDVLAQVDTMISQGNVEPDLTVNVTCDKDEARVYLLLNFFGYSEDELAAQIEPEDEQEVANEINQLMGSDHDTAAFEHEIALQSCSDCEIDLELDGSIR